MKNINNIIYWYVAIFFVLLLPVILFGSPGYYNDDIHFFQSLAQDGGVVGTAQAWLKSYGLGYRPIGIFIDAGFYAVLKNHIYLFYVFSITFYWLFIVSSGRVVRNLTHSKSIEKYLTLFMAFFPFNATAFFQLSSTYMSIAGILSVTLLGMLCCNLKPFKYKKTYFLLFLGWLATLFIYEQVLGLLMGFYVYMAYIYFTSRNQMLRRHIMKISLVLLASTFVFLGAYLSSNKNPKIQVLKHTYTQPHQQSKTIYPTKIKPRHHYVRDAKHAGVLIKIKKSLHFFTENIPYYYKNITAQQGVFPIIITLLLIAFIAAQLFQLDEKNIKTKTAVALFVIGIVCFISPLLPFMLYHHISIPVYCFMIPSFGLALSCCGLVLLLFRRARYVLTSVYLGVLVLFTVQQYAYYFGLKEELRYWTLASDIAINHIAGIEAKQGFSLGGLPPKENNHIFWLDKAVGYRVMSDRLLLHAVRITSIHYLPNTNTIHIQGHKIT